MRAGHTPGPWRVYPPGSSVPYYDVCARIVSDKPSGRSASDGPSDADAALIAAAPTLLSVLLSAVLHAEASIDSEETPWLDAARDALAKARGGRGVALQGPDRAA